MTCPARLVVDLGADVREHCHVGLAALQHAFGRLRVGRNRRERLIDLVRNAGRHLAHEVEPADVREPELQRARPLLGGALCRQVANDADESAPAAVRGLPDRERHGERLAVGAPRFDLAPLADDVRLARGDVTLDIVVVLRAMRLAHEHPHVVADDVGGGVAEHALGGSIEREDLPALVDHDDRIDRRVEQGPKFCGDHGRVLRGNRCVSSHT